LRRSSGAGCPPCEARPPVHGGDRRAVRSGRLVQGAVGLLTYAQGVEAFRVTDRLSSSDKAALMGGTLQRVYNWTPKAA